MSHCIQGVTVEVERSLRSAVGDLNYLTHFRADTIMAKPQSKTEKKIDNNVRLALTSACEQFLEDVPGFQWLTHQANYTNFPATLLITCVFDTQENPEQVDAGASVHLAEQVADLLRTESLEASRQRKPGVVHAPARSHGIDRQDRRRGHDAQPGDPDPGTPRP